MTRLPSPPPPATLQKRDVHWVEIVGQKTKYRISVLMEIDPACVLVAYTSGTKLPDPDELFVDPRSREGASLQLQKPSYFGPRRIENVRHDQVSRRIGRCPPLLFTKLEQIVMNSRKGKAQAVATATASGAATGATSGAASSSSANVVPMSAAPAASPNDPDPAD